MSKQIVQEGVFSWSDQEALSYACEKDHFELAEETHLFPEWSRLVAALESGQAVKTANAIF